MAQNAIAAAPGIFLNGAQQYQGASNKIFDAINAAADMYQKMEMQKQANLNDLRKKQLDLSMSPEAAQPILAKAIQYGPQSLTPQEQATFDAIQKIQGAKMAQNPLTGSMYAPYSPINLNSIGAGAVPTQSASPASALFAPAPGQDTLLPPPAKGQQGDASLFKEGAPAPIGAPKIEQADDTGMAETPAGRMEKYKSGLDANKEITVNNAKTQAEQKKADFNKGKLQTVLDQMADINEQLNKMGDMQNEKSPGGNIINAAKGASIPVPFTGKSLDVGRGAEKVMSPKAASLREQYDRLKAVGMQLYKNAAGLTGGQMNSDAEQKMALSVFGDANGMYEANKTALENTASAYGTKQKAPGVEGVKGVDEKDQRVQKALKAGYTMEEIGKYLNGK